MGCEYALGCIHRFIESEIGVQLFSVFMVGGVNTYCDGILSYTILHTGHRAVALCTTPRYIYPSHPYTSLPHTHPAHTQHSPNTHTHTHTDIKLLRSVAAAGPLTPLVIAQVHPRLRVPGAGAHQKPLHRQRATVCAHTPTGTRHWRPAVPRQFLIVNGAHKTSLRQPRPAGWPTDAPPPTRAAAALIPCGMLPLPPPCHGRRPGAADIVCVPRYCLDARGIPTGRGSRAARERHFYSLDNCAVRCPAIRTV